MPWYLWFLTGILVGSILGLFFGGLLATSKYQERLSRQAISQIQPKGQVYQKP